MSDVRKEDLWKVKDEIVDEMVRGFSGVHQRQDVTNGRLNAAEQVAARHDVRLKNLEREVFDDAERRRAHAEEAPKPEVVTQRDVKMIVAVMAALAAALKFAWDFFKGFSGH